MNSWVRIAALLCLGLWGASACGAEEPLRPVLPESRQVKRTFAKPSREYSSGPLWVWNDRLTPEQIRSTIRDMASQQVKQVYVHPRPGLMTPYLSDEWFALWNVALDEAAKLDMNVWIYDENSYPSGFAGGFVPELMPESRGMGLSIKEAAEAPKWDNDLVAAHRVVGDGVEDVTAKVRDGGDAGSGPFLVSTIVRSGNSGWHGDRCYVNLITPGVTEKFLEVTLGAYDKHVAAQYGKRIPGVFTDEPNIRPAGGFPWCPDLPEQFRKQWGYDLVAALPGLVREVGDWRRLRHDYFSTLNQLFIERWGKPYYEACEKRGLEFTGHYWDHEWPHCVGVPDNMAMAAWQHRPGVDTLMNQYAEHTHSQFGNVRYCREISSIANQLGRDRTFVELYGAGGWDLRFEDMKRIADWLQVLGINTMNEHLSYVTLRGARKRDHPQSFSYHDPWWSAYHVHAAYMTRVSAALTAGRQVNRVLVLEPTTTAWMYQGNEAQLGKLGDSFFQLLMSMERAQIEYDLGCEDVIGRHGGIGEDSGLPPGWTSSAGFRVGERVYQIVILPEHTETLDRRTWSLLKDFIVAGGQVISLGPPPGRMDGKADPDLLSDITVRRHWKTLEPSEIVPTLRRLTANESVLIDRAEGDRGILFHHRRELADGQLLFLVNTSLEHSTKGSVRAKLAGVERWDPNTGESGPYAFRRTGAGLVTDFEIPPSGSLLLRLSKAPLKQSEVPAPTVTLLGATGVPEARRLGPNVLTLDYVDVTAGGETRNDQYFYAANAFVWKQNGMARNPWDSAVQFKDELISKTFPAGSGFEATYRFTIEGEVPADLGLVIERPDLYTITCNGRPVEIPKGPGNWWLDRSFLRLPIAGASRTGGNEVTLKATPFTMMHELESAYLLGDFSLKPASRGFVITRTEPVRMARTEGVVTHGNNPDATMWLSGGIGFGEGVEDRSPQVTLDLGALVDLRTIRVWNYNEANVRDLTSRGVARMAVIGGPIAGESGSVRLGEFPLAQADGRAAAFQDLAVTPPGKVRFVSLKPLANHRGVTFPALGSPPDNGFVGLSEVVFLDGEGREIRGVRVSGKSGELASMRRTADRLVDGSGLSTRTGLGWNDQGMPFYAEGVVYRYAFQVTERGGKFVLSLPNWYGAVAKVEVNGRESGWIWAPPWECDVTREVRQGANSVEVTVIGTLKNTLGPHHGNHALGSAWPGMFQNAPATGQPAGSRYSNVAYGMFEPAVLKQLRTK
jgi:hypothetical protein